jgi:CRISPR locus-related DNA-binding protein
LQVLISTIYKGSAVIQAIKLFSPNKIFFIVDKPIDDIRKNTIQMIEDLFPKIDLIQIPVKTYDIVNIANETITIIKKELENDITVHISEGRKTMSLGLLFGAYVMKKYIDSAYYIIEETNQPLKLPLIELKVSNKKKEILKYISEGNCSVESLSKKLNVKPSTLYVHLKELRDDGIITSTKNLKLTDMGKIILLNE